MIPRNENISLIQSFQEKYDIHSLCVNGINIWPLVLFELNKPYTNSTQSNKKDLARIIIQEIMSLFRMQWESVKDRKNNSHKLPDADVIFLTQSTRRTKFGPVYYDRICDPYFDAVETNGLQCHAFEWSYDHKYKTPRYNPSEFIQFGIQAAIIRAFIMKPVLIEGLPLLKTNDFIEILSRHNFTHRQFIINLDLAIRQIFQLKLFFEKKLSGTNPRLAFFFPYYGIVSFAFNLACRSKEIKTVEIQHGYYSNSTYLQNGLRNLKQNLDLLPDIIWCWEKRDELAVSQWSSNRSFLPVVYIGGNLWNNLWLVKEPNTKLNLNSLHTLRVRFGHKTSINVLITLPPDLSYPMWLIDYINNSQSDIIWGIRFHHNTPEKIIRAWKTALEKSKYIEYEISNSYPLPALFQICDLHITVNSSSVIEAAAFSVPTIIISEAGCELFCKQIEKKFAYPATNPDSLDSLLNRYISTPESFYFKNDNTQDKSNASIIAEFLEYIDNTQR